MGSSAAKVSRAAVLSQVTVTEALQDAPAASGNTLTNDQFNPGQSQYTSATTIPVVYYSGYEYTLDEAGEATIDLTELVTSQADVDCTGLKVQMFRIQGSSADNGALTISPGASNPYAMFGAGNDMVYPAANTLSFQLEFGDTLPDVTNVSGVGASQIDLAGTAGDQFKIEFLVG